MTTIPQPTPNQTYKEYRELIESLVKEGVIKLSDLSWDQYKIYCFGNGFFDGVDCEQYIKL